MLIPLAVRGMYNLLYCVRSGKTVTRLSNVVRLMLVQFNAIAPMKLFRRPMGLASTKAVSTEAITTVSKY